MWFRFLLKPDKAGAFAPAFVFLLCISGSVFRRRTAFLFME